jgi:hypothetical protein
MTSQPLAVNGSKVTARNLYRQQLRERLVVSLALGFESPSKAKESTLPSNLTLIVVIRLRPRLPAPRCSVCNRDVETVRELVRIPNRSSA